MPNRVLNVADVAVAMTVALMSLYTVCQARLHGASALPALAGLAAKLLKRWDDTSII